MRYFNIMMDPAGSNKPSKSVSDWQKANLKLRCKK